MRRTAKEGQWRIVDTHGKRPMPPQNDEAVNLRNALQSGVILPYLRGAERPSGAAS